MTDTLRNWWNAQKARANYGELAQAVLRVAIGVVLLSAYYGWVDWSAQTWVRYLCWGFVALSFVLFVWIYRAREGSDVIRFVTLAVDMGTPTILLGLTGERSAILVFVYTWVAVGHGFRFGLRYLHIAWIVGLLAFVAVYVLSAVVDGFWYRHPLVWLGAFFWIGAPTFYVAQLLKQKLVAVRAAEEARVQVERAQAEAERERVERARAEAERARAEAESASEAKSDFLATMSHEMRTPLNGVVGAAEMLGAEQLPQKQRQLVDWLLTSSRQLRSLIDNLLDLRKIEAGKIVIERAPLDLHVLMNRLAILFEPEAKRALVRFTKSVSVDAPYMLMGDDVRIQQVLINLIANALKFTHQGFVRVSVVATEQTDRSVGLRFEVRDTGIGIPSENAAQIFDRFTQANPGIHRQYGGSGLGTTICKHLVELMGGAIGFDSPPGDGTTFWFNVELSRQPAEAHEDGGGVLMPDVKLIFVSRRPSTGDWLANTALTRETQYVAVASIEEALTTVRGSSGREPCLVVVDGEDDDIHWPGAPDAVRGGPTHVPCILIHPHIAEKDAFDAGYVSLLTTREPRLLRRAIRIIAAGTSAPQPLADVSEQYNPGRTGLHILVGEDNQISQQIIAMMLQSGGHQVTLVSDGESVLENYRNVSFDVIVLDMHMPGRTGLEVARTIRLLESKGRGRRMAIIMLTAAASVDLREDSLDAGVDLFLSKPVDPRALLRGVSQVFSQADGRSGAPTLLVASPQVEAAYIDRVLLQDMAALANDPRFIQTLTSRFSRDARQLIDDIEAAMIRKDCEQIRELAHALKGAAMMTGAVRLRDSAARAEKIADSDFNGGSADLIEDLKRTLEATNHELSEMVASEVFVALK
jgi:two-component system, sensor histidine kinase RpfC